MRSIISDIIPEDLPFFKDKAPPNLLDYDVIGFDVDDCLLFKDKTAFIEAMVLSLLKDLNVAYLGSCYPIEIKNIPLEKIA